MDIINRFFSPRKGNDTNSVGIRNNNAKIQESQTVVNHNDARSRLNIGPGAGATSSTENPAGSKDEEDMEIDKVTMDEVESVNAEPKSPSTSMSVINRKPSSHSEKRRRRKRSKGSPAASTLSLSSSSVANIAHRATDPLTTSDKKKIQRKQTTPKNNTPDKKYRISRTKPSSAAIFSKESPSSKDPFLFTDGKSHSARKTSPNVETEIVRRNINNDSTTKRTRHGGSKKVESIQPPLKKKAKLAGSKTSTTAKKSCDSSLIEIPMEPDIDSSSAATNGSDQESELQQNEKGTPSDSASATTAQESSLKSKTTNLDREKTDSEPMKGTGGSDAVDNEDKTKLKIPRELTPFNNPGVVDYGIIRKTRLRSRSNKRSELDQVGTVYQPVKGEIQCHATQKGCLWRRGGKNRCEDCAVGSYMFCYAHRHLDENLDQQFQKREIFWKSHETSTKKSAPASQMGLISKTKKTNHKFNTKKASIVQDEDGYENNDIGRCMFLKTQPGKHGRCKKINPKNENFCYHHKDKVEETDTEIFRGDAGSMRCTAVGSDNNLCDYKALENCVFCLDHMTCPPERFSRVEFACNAREDEHAEKAAESTSLTKNIESKADKEINKKSAPVVESKSMETRVLIPNESKKDHVPIDKSVSTINTASSIEDLESGDYIYQEKHRKNLEKEDKESIEKKLVGNQCNPPKSIVLKRRGHRQGNEIVESRENMYHEKQSKNVEREEDKERDEMESIRHQKEKIDQCNPPNNIILKQSHKGNGRISIQGSVPIADDVSNCEDSSAKNTKNRKDKKVEKAFYTEERCMSIVNRKRCPYKITNNAAQCNLCLACIDEEKPLIHILNDQSCPTPSRCIRVDRLTEKRCLGKTTIGEVMCCKCKLLCGEMKGSLFETVKVSDLSAEDKLKGSTSSSSTKIVEEIKSYTSSDSSDGDYDSDDSVQVGIDNSFCSAYTHAEFSKFWRDWEKRTEKTDEVEASMLIRRANNIMDSDDTKGQQKAQYGRVLLHAMKKMMNILELRRNDVFLDIGHGIGNTCLHASFCAGCESRGIEVVSSRHDIANRFRASLIAEHEGNARKSKPEIGKVDLRLGRLEDPANKEFLTKGVTRAYVNNFNGVFGERSSKNKDKYFLDDYIAGIFASMAPNSIMVTFHALTLGLERDEANASRKKHNMGESENASFYSYEKILLGKACDTVKWKSRSGNKKDIFVYKYRRLKQPDQDSAVFLCCNPTCAKAVAGIPIAAMTTNEDGKCVINHCECKVSPRMLRKR